MLECLLLALPGLSASHFNLAPFSRQCRSPRLLMPHWRSQPALRSCVIPVGMCARERCCVCRTSTSTSGALCAKVSVYLALCSAMKCPEPGVSARVPQNRLPSQSALSQASQTPFSLFLHSESSLDTLSFYRVLSHLVWQRNPQGWGVGRLWVCRCMRLAQNQRLQSWNHWGTTQSISDLCWLCKISS